MKSVLMLNRARNFAEFREALRYWDTPSQNFVYADTEGNIGYQTPGRIPIRAPGHDGRLPVPGWTDAYEWQGYIPFDELPTLYNPDRGYIVTANNPVVPSEYPYFLNSETAYGYRAKRIEEMIRDKKEPVTVQDVADMQADTLNLSAQEILPYLRTLDLGQDILGTWDARMDADSNAAALYAYFFMALVEETYKDQLPMELWKYEKALNRMDRFMNSLQLLLTDPDNRWWDDARTPDHRETRDEILKRAMKKAYKEARKAMGRNPRKWRWGAVHTATFKNQTLGSSGIALVETIFNRGPVETSGGMDQVNRTAFRMDNPFVVYAVSSLRQIIDLSDLSHSLMIHTTGQSGHARNRHYADFIEPWRTGSYHPIRWTEEEVRRDSKEELILRPR